MSPCQGLVGVSITPGRTAKALRGFLCGQENSACALFLVSETAGAMPEASEA